MRSDEIRVQNVASAHAPATASDSRDADHRGLGGVCVDVETQRRLNVHVPQGSAGRQREMLMRLSMPYQARV
jgi:hypothetical protein